VDCLVTLGKIEYNMPAIDAITKIKLEQILTSEFIPHLPPTLCNTKISQADQTQKNLSRALSAFFLAKHLNISNLLAGSCVIDEYNDLGVDAIYYDINSKTLYLVQSKLKANADFDKGDAISFTEGVRALLRQDYSGFNEILLSRKSDISHAVVNAEKIIISVVYTGSGISQHAMAVLKKLIDEISDSDDRLSKDILIYDSADINKDIIKSQSNNKSIDVELFVSNETKITDPYVMFHGLIKVSDLSNAYKEYGPLLFEKNIRTHLGIKTDVNKSIAQTLRSDEKSFILLNNGVTALAKKITRLGINEHRDRKFQISGLSIINGAQTVATAAEAGYFSGNAKTTITLIEIDDNSDIDKKITRARNHQNKIQPSQFAALDFNQERLRRELLMLDYEYLYKELSPASVSDYAENTIRLKEAGTALAATNSNPLVATACKKDPESVINMDSHIYEAIFNKNTNAIQLLNAVNFYRACTEVLLSRAKAGTNQEKAIASHGNIAIVWLLSLHLQKITSASRESIFEKAIFSNAISRDLDAAIEMMGNLLNDKTSGALAGHLKNKTSVIPLLKEMLIKMYGVDYTHETKSEEVIANEDDGILREFRKIRHQALESLKK
jgi:hypothetical protein